MKRTRPPKRRYYSKKRRAIYAAGEDIDSLVLFMTHGWICGLCDGLIDHNLRVPNEMAATVDHIIPLSKGGKHVWSNCQPAHLKCNLEKGCMLSGELNNQQVNPDT